MATSAQTRSKARAKKAAAEIRQSRSRQAVALELETGIRRVLAEAPHPLRADEINDTLGRGRGALGGVRNTLQKQKLPNRRARIEGTMGATPLVWALTADAITVTRPDEVVVASKRRSTKRTARKRTTSTTTRHQRSAGRTFTEINVDMPSNNGTYAVGSDGKLYVVRQLVEA